MALAALVFVLVGVAVMTDLAMIASVVAAVIVTVGIAQGAARCATDGGTQQASIRTAGLLAQYIAAGCAQAAPNRSLGAAAPVGTHRTAGGTANTCSDGRARATAQMSTDHTTHHAAQRTADCCFGVIAGKGAAAEQAQGQKNNRGMFFHQVSPRGNDEAMLAAKRRSYKP
jgi:hypothetical protein